MSDSTTPLPDAEGYFYVGDDGKWCEGSKGSGAPLTPLFTAEQLRAHERAAVADAVQRQWISVEDRLPTLPDDDSDVPVYTWNGSTVDEDDYGGQWEQPAGPAVGGWVRTGDGFTNDTYGRVTHWMPRNRPAPPAAAIRATPPTDTEGTAT